MPEPATGTSELHLKEDFPPISTSEWEAVIQADLKGADYEKRLVWKTDEGIKVKPYYRAENLPAAASDYARGGGAAWEISEAPVPEGAIDAVAFHDAGATAVQELGYAMAAAVDRLAAAADAKAEVKKVVFAFAAGSNYFFEIAKLRAARVLWAQVVSAFGVAPATCPARIHAFTALSNKSIYDPYTNLLRVTTEALSAVLGGCDKLTVRAAGFPERLARNVQLILKEEAHLDKVTDAAGGAYYVEAITDSLAREAWKLFQGVEAQGGFSAARASIDAAIAESLAAKEKAVALRRRTLVGVNNYPDLHERELDHAGEWPAGERLASAIEAIRLRTERHARKTGSTPKVLLLKSGDLKMRMARAMFCQNYFGCAGYEIEEADSLESSDASLIVLCSSDPEYLALAREVCPKAKAPVYVAGNPKEQIEELKAAGVASFVHVLSNMVETLTESQDRLGIAK